MKDGLEKASQKAIALKILTIAQEVGSIPKNGRNSFHKYDYVTEADVTKYFSKAMHKHGVAMFFSVLDYQRETYTTRANKSAFLATVKVEVKFIDTESGESMSSIFYGDGADSDDKGVYKAITGAFKYAMLKTFMVSTGDDPENDAEELARLTMPTNTPISFQKQQSTHKQQQTKEVVSKLEQAASKGLKAMRKAWEGLDTETKKSLQYSKDRLKTIAIKAEGQYT